MQNSEYFADLLKELNDQTIIQQLRYYLYNSVAGCDEILNVLHTPGEIKLRHSCELPSDTFVQLFVTNGMLYRDGFSGYQKWGIENNVTFVKES
jgi:hypothetical protein